VERHDKPSGPSATRHAPPGRVLAWDRQASWCLLALVAAALASLVWWSHPFLDPRNDACMYIQLARNLLAGEGYSLVGEPFALRPPGFSALLLPLIATWGTDLGVLNLFIGLWGVACVVLLFILVQRRSGPWFGLAVSLLLWTNPGFRTFCTQVMSDVPGVALALGCLLLEQRWRDRSPSRGLWLGIAIGLSALVRSMNLLLVPAVLLAVLLRRGDARRGLTRAALLLLGASAVLLPWSLRNARVDRPSPTEQTSIYSYGTGMFHADPSDPQSKRLTIGEVAARVPDQLSQVSHVLGTRLGPAGKPRPFPMCLAGLGLACVVFTALRRREPTEFLCLGLFVVVSSYFAFVDRLALPVFVLALPSLVGCLDSLLATAFARRASGSRRPAWIGALAIAALAVADARALPDPDSLRIRSRQMRELTANLDEALPPGSPLAARLGWELGVYMEERTVYSLFVVAKRGERAGMLDLLERRGVDHCVFHQPTADDRTLRDALRGAFQPAGRFGDWRLVQRK